MCATVHGCRGDVVILDEGSGVSATDPTLDEEADDEEREAGGVDADEEPAHVLERDVLVVPGRGDGENIAYPKDDRQVNIAETPPSRKTMHDIKRERNKEAQQIRNSNPLVPAADTKHLTRNTPRNGQRIKLLYILP